MLMLDFGLCICASRTILGLHRHFLSVSLAIDLQIQSFPPIESVAQIK